MSPLITRRRNHSVGVAICLIRPAPRRVAMARPAVASSLISRLGLSIPSPDPFALTSTPCCCKITPRSCKGVGGVQGALTLFCGGVAQTYHDDRVVELKEQLVVEEVDGEGQEGKVKEEGRGRVKENAPWMTWR